jgi:hypothetical protein
VVVALSGPDARRVRANLLVFERHLAVEGEEVFRDHLEEPTGVKLAEGDVRCRVPPKLIEALVIVLGDDPARRSAFRAHVEPWSLEVGPFFVLTWEVISPETPADVAQADPPQMRPEQLVQEVHKIPAPVGVLYPFFDVHVANARRVASLPKSDLMITQIREGVEGIADEREWRNIAAYPFSDLTDRPVRRDRAGDHARHPSDRKQVRVVALPRVKRDPGLLQIGQISDGIGSVWIEAIDNFVEFDVDPAA